MQHSKYSVAKALMSIVLLIILAHPNTLMAKQSKFKYANTDSAYQFSYAWQVEDARYALEFEIPTDLFANMPSTQPAFSNAIMQREIEVALLKYAKSIDPRTARVNIKRQSTRLEYAVTSFSTSAGKEIMQTLSKLGDEAREEYLSQHFYTNYESKLSESAIKHDHAKYAQLSAEALASVVDAIKTMQQNIYDPREFIQIALSWMQSIPYDTLENRISSNGAGYVSPKDLLIQNQGDCDSKATFLAALLRAYSSSVQQKMVLLPKHALLAIAVRAKPSDKTIRHDGTDYVLLEAAGPGYFNVGEVADSTLMGIRNHQYTLDAM